MTGIIIYYGDFDPPTIYDIDVVTKLASKYKKVIIVPTNNEIKDNGVTPYYNKYMLCKAMLETIKDNIVIENYALNSKQFQDDKTIIKAVIYRIINNYKNNEPITIVGYDKELELSNSTKYVCASSIINREHNPKQFKQLYDSKNKECFDSIPLKYINFVNEIYGNKILHNEDYVIII